MNQITSPLCDQTKQGHTIQPVYFVAHPDGSYSEADPQPVLLPISDLPGTQAVAIESLPLPDRVADDSVAAVCGRQR